MTKKARIKVSLYDFKELNENSSNTSKSEHSIESDEESFVSSTESIKDCKQYEKEEEDVAIFENKPVQDSLEFKQLTIDVAIKLAFEREFVKSLPKAVRTNSIFCVDLNTFRLEDVKADDNGAYKENGNKHRYYEINENSCRFLSSQNNPRYKSNKFVYHIYICFGTSLSNIHFRRKMIRIRNCSDPSIFDVLILSYYWDSNSTNQNFELKAHGNASKRESPYFRTSSTTLSKIKQVTKEAGSIKMNYIKLVDDLKESESVSEMPRNYTQILNHKKYELQRKNKNTKTKDEYADALVNRLKSMHITTFILLKYIKTNVFKGDFVKSINFGVSTVTCIMFTHQQYIDLIRFATSKNKYSIINIDTTFNLGDFYVTYLSYRNLSLYIKGTKTHPTFIGPIMIHLNKDFSSYLRFATELYSYDLINLKKLKNVKVIVTDDDEALHGAFKSIFKKTNFMLCCNHLRKDINRKLGQYKFDDDNKKVILDYIFGTHDDRSESLIGSQNEDEFIEKTNELIKMITDSKENFSADLNKYLIKLKLKKIMNNFCRIKWTSDEKNKINDYYTTNDIEGLNNKLKSLSEHKKMNLSQIFDFFETISNEQINQCRMAIRCTGDYDISNYYIRYRVQPNVWFNLSEKAQENKLAGFLKKNVFESDEKINIKRDVKEKNKENKKKTAQKKKRI